MENFVASAHRAVIDHLKHVKSYRKLGTVDTILPLIQKLNVVFNHVARHLIKQFNSFPVMYISIPFGFGKVS